MPHQSSHYRFDPADDLPQPVDRLYEPHAQPSLAMGAEHSRGPHGYRRITKNRLGDLEGSAPGGPDIDHSNEGARRRPLREPHLRKRAEKELPPLSVGAVGRFVVGS